MNLILLGIYGVIICIAIFCIIKIRDKKYTPGSAIEESQSHDFIGAIAAYKRSSLAKQPWNMKYETYMTIATVCAILFAVMVFVITSNIIYAAVGAVIGALVPECVVRLQASKQRSNFEERYARGLRQVSASLKSGLSIHQAIADVCQSPFVHDDVRREFQQLDADLKLSIPIKEGFERFAARVDCIDAKDVAIAIGMQARVGGREAEVVETIAKNISDRLMLRKEVNSMFAGSNGTILFLDVLPFGIIAFMMMFARAFMAPYFTSTTMLLILIGLLLFMGIGSIVIHKIVRDMRKEFGLS